MNPSERYGGGEGIIREALRRELESAPLSLPEPAWGRIRAGIFRKKKTPGITVRCCFSMRRLAAAAALLLVVLAGGMALKSSDLLAPPGLWKRDCAQPETKGEEAAQDMVLEVEPPSTLPGGFAPVNMEGGDYFQVEDHYPAAVYRRGEESLLWISASPPSTDMPLFVSELSRQLGTEIEIPDGAGAGVNGSGGGILEFKAGGRSGIAWQSEGGSYAFLTLSGSPDLCALICLWDTGEQSICPLE